MFVPVVDSLNKPLMSTSPSRARKWVKSGKATAFWKKGIFCVRLNVDPSKNYKQKIAVGIDMRRLGLPLLPRHCVGVEDRPNGSTAVELGLVTKQRLCFAVGRHHLDGGIMVSASHNRPSDIGF